MNTLVIAEHDNASLKAATLNAVAAAGALGGDVDILVAGAGCDGVAGAAAQVPGVSRVICADNAAYEHQLAENVSLLVAELGTDDDNLLAPSTANGKNSMPRVAACSMLARSLTSLRLRVPTPSSDPSTLEMSSQPFNPPTPRK